MLRIRWSARRRFMAMSVHRKRVKGNTFPFAARAGRLKTILIPCEAPLFDNALFLNEIKVQSVPRRCSTVIHRLMMWLNFAERCCRSQLGWRGSVVRRSYRSPRRRANSLHADVERGGRIKSVACPCSPHEHCRKMLAGARQAIENMSAMTSTRRLSM